MRHISTYAATFVVAVGGLVAQSQPLAGSSISAPKMILDAFSLRAGTVQSLLLPADGERAVRVEVAINGRPVVLDLRPNDVRAHDFRVLVDNGRTMTPLPRGANTTLQGGVVGKPESLVAAQIVAGQMWATVEFDGQTFGVEPVNSKIMALPHAAHVVYSKANTIVPQVGCGVNHTHSHGAAPVLGGGSQGTAMLKEAEIAIDCDRDFYRRNGSSATNTRNNVTRNINAVDAIYKRDVSIQYKITTILVRTTQTYTNTDMRQLLPEFRARWRANHAGIRRDVAHLYTGKGSFSGIVGIAYVGVICSQANGFGVDKAFHSSLTTNVGLVAHELGHNWSAGHCSGSDCRIMCAGLGGCARDLTRFGAASKTAIGRHRDSRTCLTNVGGTTGGYRFFGTACRGSAGTPTFTNGGRPVLNTQHTLTVTRAPAGAVVTFFFGTSKTNWSGIRLPFDMSVLGAPGCRLYVSGEFPFAVRANALGAAGVRITLRNDTSLVGKDFQTQAIIRDRRANALGFTTTRAATGTVGDQ